MAGDLDNKEQQAATSTLAPIAEPDKAAGGEPKAAQKTAENRPQAEQRPLTEKSTEHRTGDVKAERAEGSREGKSGRPRQEGLTPPAPTVIPTVL